MDFRQTLKTHYRLTKPGIIYGNILNAAGGYLLATRWHIHFLVGISMLVGTSLVIASACVFNNVMDRGIDKKMTRTKKRATVTGEISVRYALSYATVLGVIGFATLIYAVNWLVVVIGAIGFIDYVLVYGYYKRHSVHGTIVGSISGSTPVVAGYCAATNHFDAGALILSLILTLWQMPHFYAISLYRREDYANAGLPVMSVKRSAQRTKRLILVYIAAFACAVASLSIFGYAGYMFAAIMLGITLYWLLRGLQTFSITDSKKWGRSMFLLSLFVITSLSGMLALGSILP